MRLTKYGTEAGAVCGSKNMKLEDVVKFRNKGFAKELGIKITKLELGYAEGEVEAREMFANPIGSTHGGFLFTIIDTVGGAAATSYGRVVTSLSGNINYLNPAIGWKKLVAVAVQIKQGKKTSVYEVTVKDETGKIICIGTMTYFALDRDIEIS